MSTKNNTKRAADSTATREEADAVSTLDSAAVDTFVTAARTRVGGFHAEASAYVAAVAARGGKQGADAAVQRVILAGLTKAGLADEAYSHARYSKLSGAFHAVTKAGLDSANADHYAALYGLWNVPTAKDAKPGALTTAERDAIVTAASRSRTEEARVARILAATKAAKRKPAKDDAPAAPPADTAPADEAGTDAPATDAPRPVSLADVQAAIIGAGLAAEGMADADRIAIVATLRSVADALAESVTPDAPVILTVREEVSAA